MGEKNCLALVGMRWGKKLAWPASVKQGCCSVTLQQVTHASAFSSSSSLAEFSID